MRETGFVNQIRQLRDLEIRFRKSYSAQAHAVMNARLKTIDESDMTPEQKEAAAVRTETLFKAFYGASPDVTEIPF